jgi:(p)ppGpp synthase/HD superfamily hydrolase
MPPGEAGRGARLADAFALAVELHADQVRKGSTIPYITHLMAVAVIVGEHGGNEDQLIAALLHDAVEDQGGRPMLQKIRDRFGAHVADLVEACTDAFERPKPPWKQRKLDFLARIPAAPPDARVIIAADKIHNVRSMSSDYKTVGERLWDRFTASPEDTLWYYSAVLEALAKDWSHPILDVYRQELDAMPS